MQKIESFCDRCGKKVRENKLFEITLLLYGVFTPKPIYSDLCKECSKSFKKWLKGEEKKE